MYNKYSKNDILRSKWHNFPLNRLFSASQPHDAHPISPIQRWIVQYSGIPIACGESVWMLRAYAYIRKTGGKVLPDKVQGQVQRVFIGKKHESTEKR